MKVGADLFEFSKRDYLLIVDYYSRFPIIRQLDNKTSKTVANKFKSVLFEHGIVDDIITDNGPCFSGKPFKQMCENLNINHITSSPNNPTGNGLAEKYVGIIKERLKKAKENNEDPNWCIYIYRTTPLNKNLPSPMELFNNRIHTDLPISHSRKAEMQKCRDIRTQPKSDYSTARTFPSELKMLDKVYIWNKDKKTWDKCGTVVQILDNYQYKVHTDNDAYYIRTRKHLKRFEATDSQRASPAPVDSHLNADNAATDTAHADDNQNKDSAINVHMRASNRTKRPVKRYNEEV